MGILDRVKAQIEVWRIEKYTKRRDVTTPDFERKGITLLFHPSVSQDPG